MTSRSSSKTRLFLSLGVLLIGGGHSALQAQNADKAASERPLVIANNVEVPTFDPQKVVGVDAIIAVGNLYDRLVSLDEKSAIQPALATSWQTSPDGRVWTFKLRQDAKFHDGSPVTSEAVKFTIERAIGPNRPSSMARTYLSPIEQVDAPDPYTVVVTTKKPFAPLLNHFAHPANGAILNPAVVKAHNDDIAAAVDAGGGMYRLSSWSRNNELVLVRNEDWWGPKPAYGKVIYKPVIQAATRVIMLEKGEADVVTSIPAFEVPRLEKNPKMRVTSTNSIRAMYFAYNMKKAAFGDVKLRQALNYAVNVDGIVKAILGGHGTRARSVITHNLRFYFAGYDFKYDPDKAKSLIKEVSLPSTKLTMLAPKGRWSLDSEIAQAVAGNLRDVGLDVDLRIVGDWGQYQQALHGGDFDLAMFAWAPGSFDPDATFSSIVASTGAANFGKYSSAEADSLIRLGAESVDPAVRTKHYTELQQLLARDVPHLLLYDIVSFSAARASTCGIRVRGDEANVINDAKPC